MIQATVRTTCSDIIVYYPGAEIWYTLQGKFHLCVPFLGIAGLSPNLHIHVSVRDLYIPRIGPHIPFSRIGRPIMEICKSLTDI